MALQTLHGAKRKDQHAMLRFAAQHLLPGEGRDIELGPVDLLREYRGGRIADGETFAVARDPISIRDADARCGAVPGKNNVAIEIDLAEVRQLAIGRDHRPYIRKLELLEDIDHPFLAKSFPGEHVDAAGPE
jgi:hypothetical protein